MINNPILKGFNPDPRICRKGEDYYIAVSSFEWFPGIPIYHSRDLKNWELYTHALTSEDVLDLRRLPTGQGIWAPCLRYNEKEDLFYVLYGSMIPSQCNIDNYLITAKNIEGPWSEPVYLQSNGFDASIFFDDDGKKYVLSLEWETRQGYYRPGEICMAEYDDVNKKITSYPKRIWRGSSGRGWIEGPHIYKHDGWYYLLCAEGGTGYRHCAAVGRSKNIWGPYERDPQGLIITASPKNDREVQMSAKEDAEYVNTLSIIQKCGHASLIETPDKELYAVHLCSRPYMPEKRCMLGRETAIQKMKWSEDGWIRMANDGYMAQDQCEESSLQEYMVKTIPEFDDFNAPELGIQYYSPRYSAKRFADVKARQGYVRLYGQQCLSSCDKVSLLARKLTSFSGVVTTRMEYTPESYRHSAGLVIYYDNLNFLYLRKYYSESLQSCALSITHSELGKLTEICDCKISVEAERPINLRLVLENKQIHFEWSYDTEWQRIGGSFDATKFSDEYCGRFTGTFVGITCMDDIFRHKHADFDYFEYRAYD